MINYHRKQESYSQVYIHIFTIAFESIEVQETWDERAEFIFHFLLSISSLLYLISPKISITISPLPPCPCMQRYSAEKAAWRIRRPLFRAFFLSLNRAHSPRPVLNGARPWNRVRGHSSCLPRFIPAFGRRAVLLFPLHPPRNRTHHNYSASFLFGLFTLFSEPSRES